MYTWCYHRIYFKTGTICLPKFLSTAPALKNTSAYTQELLFKDFAVDSSCRLSRNCSHLMYFLKLCMPMVQKEKQKQKDNQRLQTHFRKFYLFSLLCVFPLIRKNLWNQALEDHSWDMLWIHTCRCSHARHAVPPLFYKCGGILACASLHLFCFPCNIFKTFFLVSVYVYFSLHTLAVYEGFIILTSLLTGDCGGLQSFHDKQHC